MYFLSVNFIVLRLLLWRMLFLAFLCECSCEDLLCRFGEDSPCILSRWLREASGRLRPPLIRDSRGIIMLRWQPGFRYLFDGNVIIGLLLGSPVLAVTALSETRRAEGERGDGARACLCGS